MNKVDIEFLIDKIGKIDSYHDMYKSSRLDNDTKIIVTSILEDTNFINYFFEQYNNTQQNINLIMNKLNITNIKNILLKEAKEDKNKINDVNEPDFREKIKFCLFELIKNKNIDIKYINLSTIDDIIIINYKLIFMSKTQNEKFNNLLNSPNNESIDKRNKNIDLLNSNISKIRIPLYYIIKLIKENDDLLNNLDTNDKIVQYIEKIKFDNDKIKNIFEKMTLPFNLMDYIRLMNSQIKKDKNKEDKIIYINDELQIFIFNEKIYNECIENILKHLKNNDLKMLLNYFNDKRELITETFNKYDNSYTKKYPSKYKWMVNYLIEMLKNKFELVSIRDELVQNFNINKTKEEIFCELISYILEKFNGDIKNNNLILDNIYKIIQNIKNNIDIIKHCTNITYPIGVLLQDNKSYITIIDDLYFKKVYPVHHNNFDQSNPENLSIPRYLDTNVLQTYNSNYDMIYNNDKILKIHIDSNNTKEKNKNIKCDDNINSIFNVNLDHNADNSIEINYSNFKYIISCVEQNNNIVNCDNKNKDNIFNNNKDKYIVKKKIITFSNIEPVKNSINNSDIKVTGKCFKNSVEILGIFINLLYKFKNNELEFKNNSFFSKI